MAHRVMGFERSMMSLSSMMETIITARMSKKIVTSCCRNTFERRIAGMTFFLSLVTLLSRMGVSSSSSVIEIETRQRVKQLEVIS